MTVQVNPRVMVVARMMESFNDSEFAQLFDLVPVLRQHFTDANENGSQKEDEAVLHFRQLIQEQERRNPSMVTNTFINGMPYDEYFALSLEEQDAIWDQIFAEAEIDIEDIVEIDIAPNAHVSA